MKVYLVEVVMNGNLQAIAIKYAWWKAHRLMFKKDGIITEIELDKVYPDGIGMNYHWHYEGDDRPNEVDYEIQKIRHG